MHLSLYLNISIYISISVIRSTAQCDINLYYPQASTASLARGLVGKRSSLITKLYLVHQTQFLNVCGPRRWQSFTSSYFPCTALVEMYTCEAGQTLLNYRVTGESNSRRMVGAHAYISRNCEQTDHFVPICSRGFAKQLKDDLIVAYPSTRGER